MSEGSPIRDARVHDTFAGAPTFTLSHRLHRAMFAVTWLLLCRWTPPQAKVWRVLILRAFGAKIDWSANVYASAVIWYPPNLSMDAKATLGPHAICYCMAPVHIGARAVVSQRAHLCAGTHDIDDPAFQLLARPISIADRAWIAAEAFVGPGVVVSEGAVLGACAVTVKNLEPFGVYAGNPARFLRKRRMSRAADE